MQSQHQVAGTTRWSEPKRMERPYDPATSGMDGIGAANPPKHYSRDDLKEMFMARGDAAQFREIGRAVVRAVGAMGSYFERRPPGKHRPVKSQQVPVGPKTVDFSAGRVLVPVPAPESVGHPALVGPTLHDLQTVETHATDAREPHSHSVHNAPTLPYPAVSLPTVWHNAPTAPQPQVLARH